MAKIERKRGVGECKSIQESEKKMASFIRLFDVHALAPEIPLRFTDLLFNVKTKQNECK